MIIQLNNDLFSGDTHLKGTQYILDTDKIADNFFNLKPVYETMDALLKWSANAASKNIHIPSCSLALSLMENEHLLPIISTTGVPTVTFHQEVM